MSVRGASAMPRKKKKVAADEEPTRHQFNVGIGTSLAARIDETAEALETDASSLIRKCIIKALPALEAEAAEARAAAARAAAARKESRK